MRRGSQAGEVEGARAELCTRLRVRQEEIESAVVTRVYALADPTEVGDLEYLNGLRASLTTAIEYGISSIELGERRCPQVPPALAAQARAAARYGVGLDTVLRRYFAGYTQLAEFALEEAEAGLGDEVSLRMLIQGQTAVFDRLIATVSHEYTREEARRNTSFEQRRGERICRLLAGEPIDSSDLDYDLENWHVAAVAAGEETAETFKGLACELDKLLLLVRREGGTVWAWLGSRESADPADLRSRVAERWPEGVPLAIGEPAEGGAGWRLSHRQAAAAFSLARVSGEIVRYSDVALLASTLQDDLLATSLHQLYLAPLERSREGGETLRETLRAYLAAGRNVSAASAALGISRQTMMKRLRRIESLLGRYLDGCTAELEAALRLSELEGSDKKRASEAFVSK